MDFETLLPTLADYAVRVIGVLLAFWVSFKLAGWLSDRLTTGLRARKFDETLSVFFGNLTRWVILVAAILACLSVFGIETTSFAAILGAAALAVGLAFQGTLSNFSAGVLLLVFRPFKIGDLIEAGGQLGVVAAIGLFVTELDTLDNRRVFIPNSSVSGGIIENFSHNAMRRVDIKVGVAYSADIDATRAVLERAALAVAGRDAERGHQVIVTGLGASSVDWQVRVWCTKEAYWVVWERTITSVKKHLEEAGIAIPFPQLKVHLDK
jgi:small conductance mechanosensitive channel